jgi:hypothetical protein
MFQKQIGIVGLMKKMGIVALIFQKYGTSEKNLKFGIMRLIFISKFGIVRLIIRNCGCFPEKSEKVVFLGSVF